jgi:hypothetical protein
MIGDGTARSPIAHHQLPANVSVLPCPTRCREVACHRSAGREQRVDLLDDDTVGRARPPAVANLPGSALIRLAVGTQPGGADRLPGPLES